MKITTLIENTSRSELLAEHGLSFYLEYKGKKFLLDGGQSAAFYKNAKSLGIDLGQVEAAVLSHGHYDHSGGLDCFLEKNETAPLYLSAHCAENCYGGEDYHYIGLRPGFLKEWEERLVFVKEKFSISEGVWLLPHRADKEGMRKEIGERCRLYRKERDFQGDAFNHELSLVFEGNNGLVVLNSCSHSGVPEILEEVRQAFPDRFLAGFFGGMHLSKRTGEEVRAYAAKLRACMAEYGGKGKPCFYTGHCTGEPACRILEKELGQEIGRLYSGCVVELD